MSPVNAPDAPGRLGEAVDPLQFLPGDDLF